MKFCRANYPQSQMTAVTSASVALLKNGVIPEMC